MFNQLLIEIKRKIKKYSIELYQKDLLKNGID